MPQMMPMYWLIMTIISLFSLMIIITFLYFFLPLTTIPNNILMNKTHSWNWKW